MGSLPRRFAFRFAFIFACLCIWPFRLVDAASSSAPSDSAAQWLQLVAFAAIGVVGAAIWSLIDRGATAPRLADALETLVRYWLAVQMLTYGLAKVFPIQFPFPHAFALDQRLRDFHPTGLLWAFMGYSRGYTIFSGLCEVLGAALLLWRRTRTIGALVVAAVMANVVMLNVCYDVPVKRNSIELLVAAVALLAPYARRALIALTGGAVAELPPRPRGSQRVERLRAGAKLVALAAIACAQCAALDVNPAPSPLDGIWLVDHATGSDAQSWHEVVVATDVRAGGVPYVKINAVDHPIGMYVAAIDVFARTITARSTTSGTAETWHYTRDGDHLEIDTPAIHAALHREPDGALVAHRTRWIQPGR